MHAGRPGQQGLSSHIPEAGQSQIKAARGPACCDGSGADPSCLVRLRGIQGPWLCHNRPCYVSIVMWLLSVSPLGLPIGTQPLG